MPIRRRQSFEAGSGDYVFEPGTTEAELDPSNVNMMAAWQNRFNNGSGGSDFVNNEVRLMQERQRLELERANAMKGMGLNPDGSPIRPEWQSLLDDQGNLSSRYKINIQGLDPAQMQGFSQYKQEALRQGPSAWANLQLQQQAQQGQLDKAAAARQAMAAQGQAQAGLAMRGGMSGGARNLLAAQGARDQLMARQKVGQGLNQQRLQTLSQDEQNRIGQLGNLANAEQQMGQYNKTLEAKQAEMNINNLLREVEGKRGFEADTYKERMKQWAANKQAEAQASSGGGGGK